MVQIQLAARGRITTHFGEDIGRGFPHRGVDQGHGDGLPVDLEIRAPAAGKVIAVGRDGSYGLRIIILHDDFTVSLLAHHARQFVTVGDRVARGQVIAVMGNTGTIYVHNHQEYRDKFGNQLDPLLHLGSTPAATELEEIDMALDAADKKWLNGMGESIITQLADRMGGVVWGHTLTHSNGVKEPAVKWLLNTSDMVGKIGPGQAVDVDKLAAAIVAKLPKSTTTAPTAVEIVAAFKAAL